MGPNGLLEFKIAWIFQRKKPMSVKFQRVLANVDCRSVAIILVVDVDKMRQNEDAAAKTGVGTAEKGPSKVRAVSYLPIPTKE